MVLKGKCFILRRAKKSDIENWYTMQQEKEVKKNFMTVPRNLKEACHELLEKNKNAEGFVIDVKGECVGGIGIHDIIRNHKATISFWLAKKYRGKGIMSEAVKLITKYAFKKYKLKRIQGHVRTFNKASAKVMKKTGYKLEGILRKNKMKNGNYLDDMIWAKVK